MRKNSSFTGEWTIETVMEKARRFCNYQERCHKEVKERLSKSNIPIPLISEAIQKLSEEGLLDEKRFAEAFVRGKFRMKSWGTLKITHGLRAKGINEELIRHALMVVSAEQQLEALLKILDKKNRQLKEDSLIKRKAKLIQHALQKGYSGELLKEAVKRVLG